jgi:hypothetical protein
MMNTNRIIKRKMINPQKTTNPNPHGIQMTAQIVAIHQTQAIFNIFIIVKFFKSNKKFFENSIFRYILLFLLLELF